ncbi:hypothetical protein GCM10009624_19230 [Gordonia sinesedis]
MIPTQWRAHYRGADPDAHHPGELVGYLVPDGDTAADADGLVVPVNLLGYPLSEATDSDSAAQILGVDGLASLADRWELHRAGSHPLRVSIVEVDARRVVVQGFDYGAVDARVERFELEIPVATGTLMRG